MINGQNLQQELSAAMQKVDAKSYLLLYLDEDQVKVTGTMSLTSLTPLLLKIISQKLK